MRSGTREHSAGSQNHMAGSRSICRQFARPGQISKEPYAGSCKSAVACSDPCVLCIAARTSNDFSLALDAVRASNARKLTHSNSISDQSERIAKVGGEFATQIPAE